MYQEPPMSVKHEQREYKLTSICTGGSVLGSRVVSVLDSGAEGPGSNRSRDAVG